MVDALGLEPRTCGLFDGIMGFEPIFITFDSGDRCFLPIELYVLCINTIGLFTNAVKNQLAHQGIRRSTIHVMMINPEAGYLKLL